MAENRWATPDEWPEATVIGYHESMTATPLIDLIAYVNRLSGF